MVSNNDIFSDCCVMAVDNNKKCEAKNYCKRPFV
jgi:hypothetical protein